MVLDRNQSNLIHGSRDNKSNKFNETAWLIKPGTILMTTKARESIRGKRCLTWTPIGKQEYSLVNSFIRSLFGFHCCGLTWLCFLVLFGARQNGDKFRRQTEQKKTVEQAWLDYFIDTIAACLLAWLDEWWNVENGSVGNPLVSSWTTAMLNPPESEPNNSWFPCTQS